MSEALRFGRIEIRPAQRLLFVEGQLAAVGARAFDVLQALAERRDRVVSKAELLDLAWPGMVVEENNLSVQISALRKALGAGAIATVTGRGYRFTPALNDAPPATALDAPVQRRLAALVCGEVCGWAQWQQRAADTAAARWRALRGEWLEPGVASAEGRIVELTPERMLFVFASPVDAVRWVCELQRSRAVSAGELPRLRFAVCIEDVIIDDGRPVGEAAHTAARLLERAPADAELVVSDALRAIVGERLPLRFTALGGHAWRVDPEAATVAEAPGTAAPPAWPGAAGPRDPRPAVAVLPFDAGEDQRYFGDGITEEIIVALSANRGLLVIARASTLRYRGSDLPPTRIAAELGVRYLLSGNVQRAGGRLRLIAELVDARDGRVIWSQRHEGADSDLFAFQTEIASSIAGAVDPRVTEAEIGRVAHVPTASLSAYDCVLRGLALQVTFIDADFAAAGDHFRRAIELDPAYAQAHAHLGWWHNLRVGEWRGDTREADAEAAETHSMRGVALDGRDALVLSIAAYIQGFIRHRLEVAAEMFEQALEINPSCAFGWCRSATIAAYRGHGEDAERRVRQAMRLSPFDHQGFSFLTTRATALLVQGRFDEAAVWYAKARRANPRYRAAWRLLVAALAQAGEVDEARALAAEWMQAHPDFRIGDFAARYPMREPQLGTVLRGMRLAGLPD